MVIFIAFLSCSYRPDLKPAIEEKNKLQTLRAEIDRWKGTPYRLGGASPNGVDCSAFAVIIYREVFNIRIPRTTKQQVKLGKQIDIRSLSTGDMIFFLPESKQMHVGIYLSHGEFAHASVSKGVTVSSMNDSYWKKRFLTARRVISF